MHPFDEMKSWIGFTEADEVRLRALWPLVAPELTRLSDLFYSKILEHPGAAEVLRDAAQVERLKGTLAVWAAELIHGPWDLDYYERRERIGRVHVQVGLMSRYMFTAMNVYRVALGQIAAATLSPGEAVLTLESLQKVVDMDLAIMTGTYVESREARGVATLQELLVYHMPVTVLLLDAEGKVTAATRPAARLFGDVPVVGLDWREAIPAPLVEAADLVATMARALESGREITVTRVDVRLDGEDRNFHVSIVPLEHPRARVLLHMEELTDAIRTEGRLARSESLAQLGALSAAVAHELRNPLAGISGAIQVIAGSLPDNDRRKPIMEKVEGQVRRLNDLVTDLLDFARPTAARSMPVTLDESARSVADLVRRDHPEVAITVMGSGLAKGDANLVHQILLNLVLNAVQAIGASGEVRMTVSDGVVRVSDSGPGIPAENAEKIFAPFFTTRTRGTGLGLAICRKAVAAMGGRLELGAGPLSGATFVLELPAL